VGTVVGAGLGCALGETVVVGVGGATDPPPTTALRPTLARGGKLRTGVPSRVVSMNDFQMPAGTVPP
jgi:hypothetical protein